MRGLIRNLVRSNSGLLDAAYAIRYRTRGNKTLDKGTNNRIIHTGAYVTGLRVEFLGSNNTIILDKDASLVDCYVRMRGDNHTLHISKDCAFIKANFMFEDHHGTIDVGPGTSMQANGDISTVEPHSSVRIGADCLFASWIDIRNTDSHSIIDNATGKRINPGRDIVIEDRVWLGNRVQVLKGVTIGHDSVVAIMSLVNKDVPPHSLAGGIPAKVIKENISWKYERIPME